MIGLKMRTIASASSGRASRISKSILPGSLLLRRVSSTFLHHRGFYGAPGGLRLTHGLRPRVAGLIDSELSPAGKCHLGERSPVQVVHRTAVDFALAHLLN